MTKIQKEKDNCLNLLKSCQSEVKNLIKKVRNKEEEGTEGYMRRHCC